MMTGGGGCTEMSSPNSLMTHPHSWGTPPLSSTNPSSLYHHRGNGGNYTNVNNMMNSSNLHLSMNSSSMNSSSMNMNEHKSPTSMFSHSLSGMSPGLPPPPHPSSSSLGYGSLSTFSYPQTKLSVDWRKMRRLQTSSFGKEKIDPGAKGSERVPWGNSVYAHTDWWLGSILQISFYYINE